MPIADSNKIKVGSLVVPEQLRSFATRAAAPPLGVLFVVTLSDFKLPPDSKPDCSLGRFRTKFFGSGAGLREEALLESAVAAPQATKMGKPLFADPVEIAAAHLFYLCRNHPFVDGNKRTALAACLVFLSENGLLPDEQLDTESWESLVMDLAASRLDRDQTTRRLRRCLRNI